ncbi:MAG: BamA/TamA family outer membrane protein [Balneola sp.]
MFVIVPQQHLFAQEDGKPDRIWNVKIEGNSTYKGIVLKRYIANEAPSLWKKLTFFNEKGFYVSETEIRRDVIRLERFYQRRGFNEVDVNYRLESKNKEWKKELIFMVVENAPIRIDSVQVLLQTSMRDSSVIYGNEKFSKELRRLPYRKGKIFQPVSKAQVESDFTKILRNLGYPYAEAEVQSKVDTLAKKASVAMLTYPGPRARFDSIFVEGETSLDAKYIRRETGISEDEYFSDNALREAQRELFGHHLLRFALISIPDQVQDSTLNVLVRVKERNLRSFSTTFGIGNFDRFDDERFTFLNSYKLFRAQASWSHRNARGKGELFSANAKLSAFDLRLGTSYLFPYVYNTKSSITISPFVQRRIEKTYSIDTGGIRNSFGYNYSESVTGTFNYDFTLNREFDVQENEDGTSSESPDSILNYNISSFKFSVYARKGQPRRGEGFTVQPFLELSGLFNEATFSFQKAALDIRGYKRVNSSLMIAARLNGGSIYYSKQDSLPADIRFYNGGSSDVRGWDRQELGPKEAVFDSLGFFDGYIPTGGKATFSFNFELRQDVDKLIKGLSFAGFIDGGQVWKTIRTTANRPIQFGVGGGIRYESPIGPIRIDLGYKLNPTDEDLGIYQGDTSMSSAWDRWHIHFSIGQAF